MKSTASRFVRLLALLLLPALLLPAPASLTADSDTLRKRKVARTGGLSQRVYEQMQDIQQLIEEDEVAAAQERLEEMQETKLTDYERAQSWFLMGYVQFRKENFGAAQKAYERVLASENLPLGLETSVLKTLAQLSMVNENFGEALAYLERLLAISERPQPDNYALKAQVHYQMEQYDLSMAALQRAEQLSVERGEPPRESWLLLKNAIYYQREDFPAMLQVVQQLVQLYPKDRYLLNMAAIYGELGDSKKQLSLMEPLYERGSLTNETQKINLASLYMLNEIPFKAAVMLQQELASGDVETTHRHLEMLAQAWLLAANIEKALEPLSRAAQLADDGETYLTLARTQMSLYRWREAEQSARKALDKGGLRDTASGQLLLGMTLFNQKKYRDARSAFAKAGEDPGTERLANQWLTYLEREEEKQELARQAASPVPLQ